MKTKKNRLYSLGGQSRFRAHNHDSWLFGTIGAIGTCNILLIPL